MDSGGLESPPLLAVWTVADAHGHSLAIYGSGGWGFESSGRATNALRYKGSRRGGGGRPSDVRELSRRLNSPFLSPGWRTERVV
jgi:hypothetical protein